MKKHTIVLLIMGLAFGNSFSVNAMELDKKRINKQLFYAMQIRRNTKNNKAWN